MNTFPRALRTGSPCQTRAERDEAVMRLIVAGADIHDVVRMLRLSEKTVRRTRREMLARAERDIQLARLKLWRQETAEAA